MREGIAGTGGEHEVHNPSGDSSFHSCDHRAQRSESGKGDKAVGEALYGQFVPYIENAHGHNVRGLKAGVWLLVFLPFVLAFIRKVTDSDKTAFLIIWIIGMFAIATVLIFAAYSDHELKQTLTTLKEIVPPEKSIEVGSLLPVDPEGEGWLIDPGNLKFPLPAIGERRRSVSGSEILPGKTAGKTEADKLTKEKPAVEKAAKKDTERKDGRKAEPKHLAKPPKETKGKTAEGKTERKTETGPQSGKEKHAVPESILRQPVTAEKDIPIKTMQLDDSFLTEIGKKKKQGR
ncbi:MAG: hypothetical protein K6C08_09540 [Oscillospiraceae bacterium]|nr:hypothetical protein [Oscillospiraceae bacterium]